MREYSRVLLLVLIMTAVAVSIGGFAILILYETAITEERQRLVDAVRSQARLIEAIIRQEQRVHPGAVEARAAALSQVLDGQAALSGPWRSAEFVLGERRGDEIVFLSRDRPDGRGVPAPVPFASDGAEPMRRALTGESGSAIGPDYRGVTVLAAYEPVALLDLGAVMKMDLAEVRAPFIRAAFAVGALGLVGIALGTTLFFRVSGPMLDEIRAGERRFRDLFDNMNSGVAVLQPIGDGADFLVTDFNRAAERIDRTAREAVVGRLLTEAFPGVEECGLLSVIRRVHASGESERVSDVLYKDERLSGWREHNVYRLPGGEVVTLYDDVSERKATEEHLREAQRLEVLGQLTGGVAHDFNNLLAIIIGNLQLLAERKDTDGKARELIADALWSAGRGAELTHRLLAFARRQPLDPRVTDVNALIRGMTGLVRRTLDSRIELRAELAPGLWPTLIDRGQLEAALMNLIVNARDAMPEGGLLKIESRNEVIGETETAEISEQHVAQADDIAAGEYIVVAVEDTGTGIPAKLIERIFEPFFTTKGAGKGSGLGLSMVYGFVKQSGGNVHLDSALGRGTRVALYLPKSDFEQAAIVDGPQTTGEEGGARRPGDG
jgi:signal transduction histidine kinase